MDLVACAEARVHELETMHHTEMCPDGYGCVQFGKDRRTAADAGARGKRQMKQRDAYKIFLKMCPINRYRLNAGQTTGLNYSLWKGQKEE